MDALGQLSIGFEKSEVNILKNGGTLGTAILHNPKVKLLMHIVDEVKLSKSDIAERGFKIKKYKNSYEVWLNKVNSKKLIEEGYFSTRCIIGRVEMRYSRKV